MSAVHTPKPLGFKRRVTAVLTRWLIGGLGKTHRIRIVAGQDVVERIEAGGYAPVIFCMWHETIGVLAPYMRRIQDRGIPIVAFTSLSRDGELVAQLTLAWNAAVVRGSSSRGGMEALRKLLRAVRKEGRSPVIIPDGPRGPRRKAKPGAMALARMSGRACIPMACAARGPRLPTWDDMLLARPFTKVAIAFGDPILVGKDSDTEADTQRLERTLNELTATAEAALE